jgi:alcohol dehydrogenase class IV
LNPEAVLYDSRFALHTPPELWLSTGLRAMDHAVETMYHPDMSELTKMMAMQAAAKLFIYLPRYKRDTTDQNTITQLQLAAFASLGYAGNGLKQPLGLSHTLGYALGSPYGIPHGITSCLTLGHVVKLKAQDPAAAEELARMAAAVGIPSSGSARADAEALGQKILQLVEDLGLKSTLAERGVGSDQLSVIVKRATGAESGPMFDRVSELVKSLL